MERGKRNREEDNSAKGKGQGSGELDPKIPPHTKWGCKEDLGKRGGDEK